MLHLLPTIAKFTLVLASALDTDSSWNKHELNPALPTTQAGRFGAGSALMKFGVISGALVLQHEVEKRHPDTERPIMWVNFVAAGATTVVAVHNYRIR